MGLRKNDTGRVAADAFNRGYYTHVSNITAESLENVFTVGNMGPEENIERLSRMYSVSVGDIVMKIDPRYFRPAEVETLLGDPSKAKDLLGWSPEISVQEMCAEMVRSDLVEAKKIALLSAHGFDQHS